MSGPSRPPAVLVAADDRRALPERDCAVPAFDAFIAQIGASRDPQQFARNVEPFVGCAVDWTLRAFGGEVTTRVGARDPAPEPHLWLRRQRLSSSSVPLGDLCTVDQAPNPVVVALPLGHGTGWELADRPNLVRVTGRIWATEPEYSNHIYLHSFAVALISADPGPERRMCPPRP